MKTFYAAEPHLNGTKLYTIGDKRDADENEVKHLVDLGVLSEKKVEPPKPEGVEVALGDLKVEELKALAEKEGVDLAGKSAKAEIVAAIQAKRSAA